MKRKLATLILSLVCLSCRGWAGELPHSRYTVLAPITNGNLTIFPVVSSVSHDTSGFLTLDEGLRSGEVVVAEAGRVVPLMRRNQRPIPSGGAEVNRLVLVNNSDRPLLLLAGEIVTGGKQDRVIGKDRIVPAHSDPIDLSVFCVEPGRWTGASNTFDSKLAPMAQPSVRNKAMIAKDQQQVWSSVNAAKGAAETVTVQAAPASEGVVAGELHSTTSYARVMDNKEVQKKVDAIAAPVARDYSQMIHELRARNAVGVVAAINGQIVWADIFAGTALLEKYWPKLVRSYAAEALLTRAAKSHTDVTAAQQFLDNLEGRREVSETEPGVFRHTEIAGEGYKVFELTSLLPKTGFDLHLAKALE